jgi:hypothetical protein
MAVKTFFTLREEHLLRMFKIKVQGGIWAKERLGNIRLNKDNEKLHNLYSPNIVRVNIFGSIRWPGHVAHMV